MQGDADGAERDTEGPTWILDLVSEVGASDFERVEPPSDLWRRIEVAVGGRHVPSPKVPPSRAVGAGTVIEYRIDAADVVVEVGGSWADFAAGNDAPELAAQSPTRTLWSYFDRDEIREVWQLLVARVRSTRSGARVPLRCDAPDARRWFEMAIEPQADDGVRFRCVLVFEEPRSSVALLDPGTRRDDDAAPIPLCSWCGRGEHGAEWLDIEDLVRAARLLEQPSLPPIDYGICGTCRDEMAADLLVPVSSPRDDA